MTDSERVLVVHIYPGEEVLGGMLTLIQSLRKHWGVLDDRYEFMEIATSCAGGKMRKLNQAVLACFRFSGVILQNFRRAKIVHIHMADGPSLYRKSLFLLMARIFGIPAILHMHGGYIREQLYGVKGTFPRLIVKLACGIIVINPNWLSYFESLFQKDRIVYIPNAVDIEETGLLSRQDMSQKSIIYMGRFSIEKGCHDLLRAFALSGAADQNFKLLIIGDGDKESLIRLIDSEGINNVEIRGWVTGEERMALLKQASLACLPSHFESFGLSALEALAAGVPVLCTPVGILSQVVNDSINGFIVPIGDTITLANRLSQFSQDRGMQEYLKQNASKGLPDWLMPNSMMKSIRNVYDATLNEF